MRHFILLLVVAASTPTALLARDTPYYGPIKGWSGGRDFGMGFKDEVQRDGSWRSVANTRGDQAVDMAIYRAAEMARSAGYDYVQLLGGNQSRSAIMSSATLFARPSHAPATPTDCKSRRRESCYTADVAEVMRRLGGPDGVQPSVAIVDHLDEYGRKVSYSGYGIGRAGATPLPATVPARRFALPPMPSRIAAPAYGVPPVYGAAPIAASPDRLSKAERYEQLLRAAQPVSHDARLGWTATD